MINRYASAQFRMKRRDSSFLNERLNGARSYDRIAGYFSSSILEVAGEALESINGNVRIVCNSQLDIDDVVSLTSAQNAMRREWCDFDPLKLADTSTHRFQRLHEFLKSGKLQVKVIPNEAFGLIHGKAGVITLADGTKTSFIGSINETYSAWKKNYEILWEDNSEEAVKWVEDEFNYFFNHDKAIKLTDFIENDLERIINRKVIYEVDKWKEGNEPASAVIESRFTVKNWAYGNTRNILLNWLLMLIKRRGTIPSGRPGGSW
jgi:phosphatidylserine/phosphatidylglycerophosphate/cardiolipin synthase-like enzyme